MGTLSIIQLHVAFWNGLTKALGQHFKGSEWIRLVLARPFPLNSGAPIASANYPLMVANYSRPTVGHNPVLIQSHPFDGVPI